MAANGDNGLITQSFREQALSFPDRVTKALAEIKTRSGAKEHLDKGVTMQKYAQQLKAGIEIEKPIAIGLLKLKAKVGELYPPEKGGRGKKTTTIDGASFDPKTITAYRKIAAHAERIDEFADSIEDVPTQGEFIRFVTGHKQTSSAKSPSISDEWSLHDGLEAINEAVRDVLERWPKEFIETLGHKLISMGEEIRDTGGLA